VKCSSIANGAGAMADSAMICSRSSEAEIGLYQYFWRHRLLRHMLLWHGLSVWPYVTLVHPAKAVGFGLNEVRFGRDTRVVPTSNALNKQ